MTDAVLILLGLALLLVGADLLVKGASSIAARYGVSSLTIGLTVVSFGTSLPEMVVSVIAGARGSADLAVANVLGSNLFNILVVLGVSALIYPLRVQNSTVVSEIPFSLSAAILLGFLANSSLFSTKHELSISRLDGAVLLVFFLLFMLYAYSISRTRVVSSDAPLERPLPRSIAFVLVGTVALFFGGEWAVDGAVALARRLGVDDALIGLTIVAVGTSLPEMMASAMAAYRKETDIAVGNVVGSNIFNILWILGLTASIHPLPFNVISNVDIVMVILATLMILLAILSNRAATITRLWGAVFVAVYIAYMVHVVQRG